MKSKQDLNLFSPNHHMSCLALYPLLFMKKNHAGNGATDAKPPLRVGEDRHAVRARRGPRAAEDDASRSVRAELGSGWASAAHAAGVKTRGTSTAALCVVLDPPVRPAHATLSILSHATLLASCTGCQRIVDLSWPLVVFSSLAATLRGLDWGRRCVTTLPKADRISWLSFGGANGTHDVMIRQQVMA
jgi:hypothetical protein